MPPSCAILGSATATLNANPAAIKKVYEELRLSASKQFYGIQYEPIDRSGLSEADFKRDINAVLASLIPVESPVPLIRIGGDADGAYLLPDDFKTISACFSPGVDNRKLFEDELVTRFGMKTHMCDLSSDLERFSTPLIPNFQTFKKCWLDVHDDKDSITLASWVKELAGPRDDLMLQMDIEGAEFRNILACDDATLFRFRIVAMEIHGLFNFGDVDIFYRVLKPFFEKLTQNFAPLHIHPNNYNDAIEIPGVAGNIPNCIELIMLRKDRFNLAPGQELIAPQLPHPLDIINTVRRAPIIMNEFWLGDRERGVSATLKLLSEEMAFVRYSLGNEVNALNSSINTIVDFVSAFAASNTPPPETHLNESGLIEVADGKFFELDAALSGYPKYGVVNNCKEIDFFFHTEENFNARITIDFADTKKILLVKIYNRKDGAGDRTKTLFISIGKSPNDIESSRYIIPLTREFANGREPAILKISEGVVGRYLTIASPSKTYLHFQAVEAFVSPD